MEIKFDKILKKLREADTSISYRAASKVVAANDSLDKTNADYICDGTADEVQINAAITSLSTIGGIVILKEGTYNLGADIVIDRSKVSLVGVNSGASIINCNGAKQIIASGSYTDIEIANLRIKSSTDVNGAIYLSTVSRARIHSNYFTDNGSGSGNAGSIKISASPDAMIFDNHFNEANGNGYGIFVANGSQRFTISRNKFRGGQAGLTYIFVGEDGSRSQNGKICDNDCYLDIASHRFVKTDNTGTYQLLISGNVCEGTFTFCFDTNSDSVYMIGNTLISGGAPAGSEGFVARSNSILVGNVIKGTLPENPYMVVGAGNVVYGNIGNVTYVAEDTKTISQGNYGNTAMEDRKIVKMKNTSGGALAKGDVVVLKAVAAGNEVTTTTTGGDPKVFGMALETINDAAFGYFLTKGKTVSLKVDGTTDIAIGDLLSTFTTAKIAKKASTGEVAFAMALEAYTTNDSAGVIDAILIEPRVAL